MIEFRRVNKIYYSNCGSTNALQNISFSIKKDDFVCIVGKSGAGKTTLINLIIGEEKPNKGKVLYKGRNVAEMSSKQLQRLRRKIGVIHQDYKLLYSKNVRENVEYIMQVIGARDKDIRRDVPQVLELVGLDKRQGNFPEELSGGERQRLAIARSLCHRPEVIIADEPTGNLDLYNTFEIVKILKKIHQWGTTIIISTHNKEVIDRLKKRTLTLEDGKIVKESQSGGFII